MKTNNKSLFQVQYERHMLKLFLLDCAISFLVFALLLAIFFGAVWLKKG
jgi:hypothetical protein